MPASLPKTNISNSSLRVRSVMPSSGLCRVITANGFVALVSSFVARHNQRVFRKANSGSPALKRGAAKPAGANF
jgi:hypothetical protein